MSDRTDVTNKLFTSPQERAKIDAVFGPQGTRAFEAFLRRENIFDASRKAVTGNSTTARQLIELGLSHGVKALGTGMAGGLAGEYFGGPQGALEGFGLGAAGKVGLPVARALGERVGGYVDRNVARRVAELLTSSDPAQLQRGLSMVANNRRIAQGLRAIEDRLSTAATARGAPKALQAFGIHSQAMAQADDTNGFVRADDTNGSLALSNPGRISSQTFRRGDLQLDLTIWFLLGMPPVVLSPRNTLMRRPDIIRDTVLAGHTARFASITSEMFRRIAD